LPYETRSIRVCDAADFRAYIQLFAIQRLAERFAFLFQLVHDRD
jgi:hypothetical protein